MNPLGIITTIIHYHHHHLQQAPSLEHSQLKFHGFLLTADLLNVLILSDFFAFLIYVCSGLSNNVENIRE